MGWAGPHGNASGLSIELVGGVGKNRSPTGDLIRTFRNAYNNLYVVRELMEACVTSSA